MTKIKGIIFDKDGTLFDFNATWGHWTGGLIAEEAGEDDILREALAAELSFDMTTQRFNKDSIVIASTADEVADAILPYLPDATPSALIQRMNARASAAPQIEAAPLKKFLTGLKNDGFKIGVATNDSEMPARAHLAQAGVETIFDFIAGYDSGYGGKPAPGQLIAFCEATGVVPAECIMVGDSTHDLMAGRAAGMRCVAVLTGIAERPELAPHADVVLNSIADLPDWIADQD